MEKNGDLFIESLHTLFDESKIRNFIRTGDTFELAIEGFPSTVENPLLIVNINGQNYNIFPTETNRNGEVSFLKFSLPMEAGKAELSIVSGTDKSDPFPIEIGEYELPLLLTSNPRSVKSGDFLSLSGDNFDQDTTVFLILKLLKPS